MALWLLPKRRFLCVGAKANVPLCGGKKMNKKCAVGKKKKYTRVSKECRLTRCPVSIWSVFVCLSVKMVYFSCPSVRYCQVARSSVTLAANLFIPAIKLPQATQISQLEEHLPPNIKYANYKYYYLIQFKNIRTSLFFSIQIISVIQSEKIPGSLL